MELIRQMKANVWFVLNDWFACGCYMNNMNYTLEGIYHFRWHSSRFLQLDSIKVLFDYGEDIYNRFYVI